MGELLKSILEAVRAQDLFGMPVQLTYKGKTAFNSICGGFISIVMILGFVAILSY